MKKARTKFLSLLLALCMVISMIPVAAFAAEEAKTGSSAMSGGYLYELDDDGWDSGTDNMYIIVGDDEGKVLAAEPADVIDVAAGDTIILDSRDNEYYFYYRSQNRSYYIRNAAAQYLYHSWNELYLQDNRTQTWTITHNGNGNYTLLGADSNGNWRMNYDSSNNDFRCVNSAVSVRLYKYAGEAPANTATFNATLDTAALQPDATRSIAHEVLLASGDVSSYDITWTSSNPAAATVNDGVITGEADGNTTITATLNSVNGQALDNPITHSWNISVQSKQIASATLKGNDDITVRLNATPNYSKVYLAVTYSDGSPGTIDYGALTFSPVDTSVEGTTTVTVSYGGQSYGTMKVTVSSSPYAGLDTATTFPVYPAPGSVRLNKTAAEIDFDNTGTVQVELSTAGISMKTGVDVILVTDLSNSMAREAGATSDGDYEDTKLDDLKASVASFADIFLADDADGTATDNTVSLVTFGGYDADYVKDGYNVTSYNSQGLADSTQTLLTASNSAATVKNTINAIDMWYSTSAGTNFYLSFDGRATYKPNYGNTNYDHAFMETSKAIAALKAAYATNNSGASYDDSGRQIYILFMTDGAPSNYEGIYYNYQTSATRPDVNTTWVNASGVETTYQMGTGGVRYQVANWYAHINGNDLTWANTVYNTPSVADIYSIGFDLDNGGFGSMTFTEASGYPLSSVLKGMVTGATLELYEAEDEAALSKIYSDLATKIRNAGTEAKVTDVVDSNFTLQLSQFGGGDTNIDLTNPTIEVRQYEMWTAAEVAENGYSTDLIGTRKRYDANDQLLTDPTVEDYLHGSYKWATLEEVTFTFTNGKASAAASNLLSGNILSESGGVTTITAKYFTYTNDGTNETFKWNIGDITEGEVALNYFAYLKDSMGENGGAEKDFYYTNEYAYLEYIDINGDYAKRDFPMPQVYWGGASTMYEFYLVNENGQPCDRNGNVLQFEDRIVITGPFADTLNLNTDENYYSKEIVAAQVLPAGYTLYDETSAYYVKCASGTLPGELVIEEPGYGMITEDDYTGEQYKQVTNDDGSVSYVKLTDDELNSYTGIRFKPITVQTTKVVYANTPSYVQSHVAFGVVYNLIPQITDLELTPDKIVIDYGKAIEVDITNGNKDLTDKNGKTYDADLVGFGIYDPDTDLKMVYTNTAAKDNFPGAYGVFSVSDSENCIVKYTPNKMVDSVENIFCHVRVTELKDGEETSNVFYMVDWLTVIPATNVYYETDFATGVFTTAQSPNTAIADYGSTGMVEWQTHTDTVDSTAAADEVQDDGTIGKNQTYGYDSTYNDDGLYSNGSSAYVEGEGYNYTYVTFSFKGTGFDLYSRTGANQGQIRAQIYSDASMTDASLEKTVTVLNKSDSNLELYQIPVISVTEGLNYGTHHVKIAVQNGYTNTAVPALNRGNQFYFDSIRVYNPAQGNAVAEAAYNADGEANNQINEVRALLLTAETFNALATDQSAEGVVFVDSVYENFESTGKAGSVTISDYAAIGPNNEVYLAKGQAIAFQINADKAPASFDIGAKSITGATAVLNAVVTDAATTSYDVTTNIASSSAQYISLMNDKTVSAMSDGQAYVVITNTGEGVLSITDIKAAYGNNTAAVSADDGIALASAEDLSDPYAVTYTANAATFAVARSVMTASADIPEETLPEETVPEETVPEETEPEATEPEVTEPEVTEPEVTEPEVTEPEVTEPEATEPEATEPEEEYYEQVSTAINKILSGLSSLLNKWFN